MKKSNILTLLLIVSSFVTLISCKKEEFLSNSASKLITGLEKYYALKVQSVSNGSKHNGKFSINKIDDNGNLTLLFEDSIAYLNEEVKLENMITDDANNIYIFYSDFTTNMPMKTYVRKYNLTSHTLINETELSNHPVLLHNVQYNPNDKSIYFYSDEFCKINMGEISKYNTVNYSLSKVCDSKMVFSLDKINNILYSFIIDENGNNDSLISIELSNNTSIKKWIDIPVNYGYSNFVYSNFNDNIYFITPNGLTSYNISLNKSFEVINDIYPSGLVGKGKNISGFQFKDQSLEIIENNLSTNTSIILPVLPEIKELERIIKIEFID